MTPQRLRRLALGVLIAALTVAACSDSEPASPPPPIVVGAAPEGATSTIKFPSGHDESGFFNFGRWPSACSLLTDDDLRAVFPQVTDIRRQPASTRIKFFSTGQEHLVPNAQCKVEFSLPGAPLPERQGFSGSTVQIDVLAAGTEEIVRLNWHPHRDRIVQIDREAECYTVVTTISCMKGQLAFEIGISLLAQQGGSDKDFFTRYMVAGQVTTIESDEVKEFTESESAFAREHIAPELAKAILKKY